MCVTPGPRPTSWTGKAGAGRFSVDTKVGGEWKNFFFFTLMSICYEGVVAYHTVEFEPVSELLRNGSGW